MTKLGAAFTYRFSKLSFFQLPSAQRHGRNPPSIHPNSHDADFSSIWNCFLVFGYFQMAPASTVDSALFMFGEGNVSVHVGLLHY